MSSPLRSRNWFGRQDLDGFVHRSWVKAEGFSDQMFDGRPVIGIANSWSELTNCNAHLRQVAEAVKRGVSRAGGFPLEFPTISLGEVLMKPTTMLFRNLMAMDVEECIRAYPLDGVVLLSGCDKTTPAMLMGAASRRRPGDRGHGRAHAARHVGTGGARLRHRRLAAWAERRAGRLSDEEWCEVESCMSRSAGHCMVMGTASTMASMAEALGMTLPGNAAIPAAGLAPPRPRRADGAAHRRDGRRGPASLEDPHPRRRSTTPSAPTWPSADRPTPSSTWSPSPAGGRRAAARRASTSCRAPRRSSLNVRPSGKYLMEDFFYAGGLPAVLKELLPLLHGDALTVNGQDPRRERRAAPQLQRGRDPPARRADLERGRHGDPDAATSAPTAPCSSSPRRRRTCSPTAAAPSSSRTTPTCTRASTIPIFPSTSTPCSCLKRVGPKGAPGMPEWGAAPIPQKLLKKGVKDMVRISDARMSGTSYGTVVLHVAPEAEAGGPLALVQDGDLIELDVPNRRLTLRVPDEELARRRSRWTPRPPHFTRGYGRLFLDHVLQANEGVDFDFLRGQDPSPPRRHRRPESLLTSEGGLRPPSDASPRKQEAPAEPAPGVEQPRRGLRPPSDASPRKAGGAGGAGARSGTVDGARRWLL